MPTYGTSFNKEIHMQDEFVDDLSNEIMDFIRQEFQLKEDSDRDDRIYGVIHVLIRQALNQKKESML